MRRVALIFCAILFAVDAAAQGRNVTLLKNFRPAMVGYDYSDVWGYHWAATGKEYALIGSEQGTHIVDCTDPRNPVARTLIPTEAPGSFGNVWRDVKTCGHYAYIVSEAHGGMQIVDLVNPDAPIKLGLWGSTLWSNAHKIAVDADTGLVYVTGTNTGTHVIDVRTNPTNPTRIFVLGAPYVHDMTPWHGYGYFADIWGNNLQIYDIAQLPGAMPLVSSTAVPGGVFCHSVWPNRKGSLCVACNETSGGPVTVWGLTNKRLPVLLGTLTPGPATAIPHNPVVRDEIVHLSYYTEGYRIVDLTDPANPVDVGYYDTSTGTLGSYEGAWGVYPLQPSGVVYVSDIQNGLFVLDPKGTATRYGSAVAGSLGRAPQIHAYGSAFLGNTGFRIEVDNAPSGAYGVFLLGASRAALPLGGITLRVGINPAPLVLLVAADAAGEASVPLPVPLNAWAGAVLDAQFVFADSAARFDYSATSGIEFELFAR